MDQLIQSINQTISPSINAAKIKNLEQSVKELTQEVAKLDAVNKDLLMRFEEILNISKGIKEETKADVFSLKKHEQARFFSSADINSNENAVITPNVQT